MVSMSTLSVLALSIAVMIACAAAKQEESFTSMSASDESIEKADIDAVSVHAVEDAVMDFENGEDLEALDTLSRSHHCPEKCYKSKHIAQKFCYSHYYPVTCYFRQKKCFYVYVHGHKQKKCKYVHKKGWKCNCW